RAVEVVVLDAMLQEEVAVVLFAGAVRRPQPLPAGHVEQADGGARQVVRHALAHAAIVPGAPRRVEFRIHPRTVVRPQRFAVEVLHGVADAPVLAALAAGPGEVLHRAPALGAGAPARAQ